MLVEDEETVRRLFKEAMERSGYQVLEARDGRHGWEVFQGHPGPINLLVTDVVMPQMSGRELAERILGIRPEVEVLFMSGYTSDARVAHSISQAAGFLQKPFLPNKLVESVREALDRARAKA